jgi:uncharacterized membrane protein
MTDVLDMVRFRDLVEARGRSIERKRHIIQVRIFMLAVTASGLVFTIFAWQAASVTATIFTGCWTIMAALGGISANKDVALCETVIEAYDKVLIPEHKRN